jgi:ubiquitin carboxyl-terminal hydrolase L3
MEQEHKLPKWIPLESNPELLNGFMKRMGVEEALQFHDVLGLDDELLQMVPQPCIAVCLLFPIAKLFALRAEKYKAHKCLSAAQVRQQSLLFVEQISDFGNACGTIACVHIAGNLPVAKMPANSPLQQFAAKHRGRPAHEVGLALAHTEAIHEASEAEAASEAAQTEAPDREDDVGAHFVAFIHIKGRLVEFDGTLPGPVDHGPCTAEGFLPATAAVIRDEFMALDPESLNFNVTALVLDSEGAAA